jgi:hypothetical protein
MFMIAAVERFAIEHAPGHVEHPALGCRNYGANNTRETATSRLARTRAK